MPSTTTAGGGLPPTFVPGFHDEASVRAMPYRAMPDGRLLSALSFGASSLAGVFRADVSEAEAAAVVAAVVRAGVNLLDTAPWYGYGESERILGRCLRAAGVPRGAYYLSTKVGRYLPDLLEQFDFTYARTLRSVDESLARLQVDYIDTVQVHDPEFAPSLDIILSETLPALEAARAAGKIRRIGITGYPLSALRDLAARCPPGIRIDSALSYCHFNLHDTTLTQRGGDGGESTLAFLAARGIGVVCGSPLSMGLLTPRGPPAWHPASPGLKARCAAAAAYAAERGADIAHLALHFALFSQDEVVTIMVSSASLPRVRHDLDVVTGKAPLAPAHAALIEDIRARFFSPAEPGNSWEGREVDEYWVKVGKLERSNWYRAHATFPDKLPAPETKHSHKA